MRFRLANGNVVASTKQPLKKDFDVLIIDYVMCDETSLVDASISLLNPSSHLLRLAHSGRLSMTITPEQRFNSRHKYKGLNTNYYRIDELNPGWNYLDSYIDFGQEFVRDNVRGSENMYDNQYYEEHGLAHRPIYRLMNPTEFEPSHDQWGNTSKFGNQNYRDKIKNYMNVCLWVNLFSKYQQVLLKEEQVEVDKDY